jgi:hypothetical protein
VNVQDDVVEIGISRIAIEVLGAAHVDWVRLRSAPSADDVADPGLLEALIVVDMAADDHEFRG